VQIKTCRSLLFIPATNSAFIEKAHLRGADAVIVDLEDSVLPARKQEARALAALAVVRIAAHGQTVVLRVNPGSATWRQDLHHMPLATVAAIMLPKVESAMDVQDLATALQGLETFQGLSHQVPIAALIESPLGVLHAATIAQASPRLCALGFGVEDYSAAIGVAPAPVALVWPAQQLIVAANAYGLACWGLADSIAAIDDMEQFQLSVNQARAMGFTGSVAVHPRQVAIINNGFSPSASELAWAEKVLAADAMATIKGQGVVLLDGRMIDRPIVERARQWVAQSRTPSTTR
jgi:citrate lyase subunit beta / citryl-CoA lyase